MYVPCMSHVCFGWRLLAAGLIGLYVYEVGFGVCRVPPTPSALLIKRHPPAVHGVASWFDVLFDGSQTQRWLSTAPGLPITHW